MTFDDFERRAKEIFESIPADFKEGVDGLLVERGASPHPSLPDIFTLGECRTEHYPGDFGGPGQVRSFVVLFYGSFRQLARRSDHWDWEEELWETITHEIKHHLESLALEDALEVEDYVVDQNYARREGEPFEPFFFRDGAAIGDNTYEIDGDVFLEVEIGKEELSAGRILFELSGNQIELALPEPLGDVHFLTVVGFSAEEDGETIAVLVKRRTLLDSLRGALKGGALDVQHSTIDLAPS
jgi:hypothetical protein